MIKPLLCLLLATAAGVCQSQSVWRCGADGRSFSDVPCPEGRVMALAEPRGGAEGGRVDGSDVGIAMVREQRLARQYAEQRLEREREARVLRELSAAAPRAAQAVKPSAPEPAARPQRKPKRQAAPSARHTSRAAVRVSPRGRD